MKILVIGANGQIGREFCTLARQAGLDIRALVRDATQEAFFTTQGIEVAVGDLEGDFAHAFTGCDQVIFTAGSGAKTGADKTLMVDLYGAMRSIDLARQFGLRRFIMVSAFRVKDPLAAPEGLRPYLAAKLAADHYLMHAGLPYIILRPGRLTNEAASGSIRTEQGDDPTITISRANTALSLLETAKRPELNNRIIDLLDGETPVQQAIAALV